MLDFIETKDDVGGSDNWSYKMSKAQIKSSPTRVGNFYPHAVLTMVKTGLGKTLKPA